MGTEKNGHYIISRSNNFYALMYYCAMINCVQSKMTLKVCFYFLLFFFLLLFLDLPVFTLSYCVHLTS